MPSPKPCNCGFTAEVTRQADSPASPLRPKDPAPSRDLAKLLKSNRDCMVILLLSSFYLPSLRFSPHPMPTLPTCRATKPEPLRASALNVGHRGTKTSARWSSSRALFSLADVHLPLLAPCSRSGFRSEILRPFFSSSLPPWLASGHCTAIFSLAAATRGAA